MRTRRHYESEHDQFRQAYRTFLDREVMPYDEQWQKDGKAPRSIWKLAGENGFLCPQVPEKYGGLNLDYRFNAVMAEETLTATLGFMVHSDIVTPYLLNYGSEEQKQEWLPKMITGEVITAIAMTEPDAGSDLRGVKTTAVKDSDHYVINGSKTYISNGQNADLIFVICQTINETGENVGISIILVEATREGFARGRNLEKIGMKGADTSELFFADVRVPITNCLGAEGKGFACLMSELSQERLGIGIAAVAGAQATFDMTLEFVKDRKAFGSRIADFQNTRFKLAEMRTNLEIAWSFLDDCLGDHVDGKLDPVRAAMFKLWTTEMQCKLTDDCLQMYGGAGYMLEYPIARIYQDVRVQRIHGGTSEIMKEIIGRSLA